MGVTRPVVQLQGVARVGLHDAENRVQLQTAWLMRSVASCGPHFEMRHALGLVPLIDAAGERPKQKGVDQRADLSAAAAARIRKRTFKRGSLLDY